MQENKEAKGLVCRNANLPVTRGQTCFVKCENFSTQRHFETRGKYRSRNVLSTLILSDYGPQAGQSASGFPPGFDLMLQTQTQEVCSKQPTSAVSRGVTTQLRLWEGDKLICLVSCQQTPRCDRRAAQQRWRSALASAQTTEHTHDEPENRSSRPPHPIRQNKQAPRETRESLQQASRPAKLRNP